jgi:hypothetical protein
MTPRFIMHSGYKARKVEFVLSRERNGWKFYGRDANGYLVPATSPHTGKALGDGVTFASRDEAATYARFLRQTSSFPAYAVWNGRKRAYDGKGDTFLAIARDAPTLN